MYRHGIWNVNPPHSSHAWSPLPVGYLYIDHGEAPVLQLPERWRAPATRTLIDIPMYRCLSAGLHVRQLGPLIHDDQGYPVPALGAKKAAAALRPRPAQAIHIYTYERCRELPLKYHRLPNFHITLHTKTDSLSRRKAPRNIYNSNSLI